MMQATEPRHGNDPRIRGHVRYSFSLRWRLLTQPEMGSVLVVIADVLIHQPLPMASVQYDHMIEQIAAAVADEALGHTVLPRAAEAGSFGLDAEAADRFDDLSAEVRSTVEDQLFRSHIVRERLSQLLNNPCARRMTGNVEMKNAASVMRDHEEAVQHAEGERGHDEEIHRRNRFAVVAEERHPPFCRLRTSRRFPHPAQDSSLGDVESEHLQFSVNARRAPGGIFGNHAEDQFAQFFGR